MIDHGTQWFNALYVENLENNNKQFIEFSPTVARTPFVCNLFNRGIFHDLRTNICNDPHQNWMAWPISEFEYNRVKKLIELSKFVDEFEKISKL